MFMWPVSIAKYIFLECQGGRAIRVAFELPNVFIPKDWAPRSTVGNNILTVSKKFECFLAVPMIGAVRANNTFPIN